MRSRIALAMTLLVAPLAWAGEQASELEEALAGLRRASPRERIAAAWQVGEAATPEVREAWTAVLRDPERADLHFEAAARLGTFDDLDDSARKALETAMKGDDRAVRLAAAVALKHTPHHRGAFGDGRRDRPGEAWFGPLPERLPAKGGPTAPTAEALDGTLWVQQSPINILGENTLTFVAFRRFGGDLVARVASARQFIVRDPRVEGAAAPGRRWRTDWSLSTGWIDARARTWHRAPAREGRTDGGAVAVGLVDGRLVAPALLRVSKRHWSYAGPRDRLELRFRAPLVVGRSGTVEVTVKPVVGDTLTGTVGWRLADVEGRARLQLDERMPIPGGARRLVPNAFHLDLAQGAGEPVDPRNRYAGTWQFVGRPGGS